MTPILQNGKSSLVELIRLSRQFSKADRLLLAKILLDSVVDEGQQSSIGAMPSDEAATQGDEAVARERSAFLTLHPSLFEKYPKEYVAIHDGQLIDHDPDGRALTLRVYEQFPEEFVWIAPVNEQPVEEWVVRSPRFEPVA